MFFWLELISNYSIVVFVSFNIFSAEFKIIDASSEVLNETQAMIYLAQYGYLGLSVDEIQSGIRLPKQDTSRAVKEFQDFNNLHVTGNLDKQTMSRMQEPRCGFPDKFPRDARIKGFLHASMKWTGKKITFAFEHDSKKLPIYVTRHEIYRAFKIWEQFIPMKFELANKEEPNIMVSFEIGKHQDQEPFDGPLGVLAHAIGPQRSRRYPSFVHFDDDEYWHVENEKNSGGPNLFQVAVHEIGHNLGLLHSKDEKSIMRAHYPGFFNPDFRLPLDDVYAIQTLYPKNRKFKSADGKPLHTTVPSRPKRKRKTTYTKTMR